MNFQKYFSTWTNYVTVKLGGSASRCKKDFSTWTNYVTVKQFLGLESLRSHFSTWTNYVTVKHLWISEGEITILVPEQITWL